MAGALLGSVPAIALVRWGGYSLSVDGLSIPIEARWQVAVWGAGTAIALGVLAGLVPAIMASRRTIVECFRTV
jgi:ABC-type antimicrobial peptide transport system permease subunit